MNIKENDPFTGGDVIDLMIIFRIKKKIFLVFLNLGKNFRKKVLGKMIGKMVR